MSTTRSRDAEKGHPVAAGARQQRQAWRIGSGRALLLAITILVGSTVAVWGHNAAAQRTANPAPSSATRTGATTMDMCAPATALGGTTAPMVMQEGGLQMEMYPTTCTPPTWAEFDRVHAMLARAKAATDKYRDFNVAVQDGYSPYTVAFVQGQGYHFANPAYLGGIRGRPFDLLHPPFLVYDKVHGHFVLQGLMYYVPATMTERQLAAIFPQSMASWHRHLNLCLGNGTVLRAYTAADCAQQGGEFYPSTGWMVHVWFWRANSGIFTIDM
jgi:hypothetical protein